MATGHTRLATARALHSATVTIRTWQKQPGNAAVVERGSPAFG